MISKEEYEARQRRFADALRSSDFDGVLVVSRGGSTLDRYAQVLYLTGHYQHYSYLPDAPDLFSGRAHAALVLSNTGAAALCVSVPEIDQSEIAVDDIRHSESFVGTIADAVGSLGLERGRLGLVGSDVLPLKYWRELVARLPHLGWTDCDEVLMQLRRIKSPAEQQVIREAASIHRRGTSALMGAIAAGCTEADLVAAFAEVVIGAGCGLYFTSVSSGEATRRWSSSSLPGFSNRVLRQGDLVRFDMGIVHRGYLSDFGRAVVVGEPDQRQQRLLAVLHHGLDAAIAAVKPGAHVREIVAAGEAALLEHGVVASDESGDHIVSSFPVHWGHGLGLGWERPWLTGTEDSVVEPGMYLAIERALTLPGAGTAAAEQNLLVGEKVVEVLTAGSEDPWS